MLTPDPTDQQERHQRGLAGQLHPLTPVKAPTLALDRPVSRMPSTTASLPARAISARDLAAISVSDSPDDFLTCASACLSSAALAHFSGSGIGEDVPRITGTSSILPVLPASVVVDPGESRSVQPPSGRRARQCWSAVS